MNRRFKIKETSVLLPRVWGKIVLLKELKEVKPYSGKSYFMVDGYYEENGSPIVLPIECFNEINEKGEIINEN